MNNLSRRSFAKKLTASAVAGAALDTGLEAKPPADPKRLAFPKGFLWGTATASYQIEGGASEDGRKPSVWDTFSHTPGKTYQGQSGDVADDSYHLYNTDIQLMKDLGVKVYRMSVAWPRVFPDGIGALNEKGLGYYERVIDELLASGIEPYVTLFHWDLPQALEDSQGGWRSRDTAKAFGDYAGVVGKRLSDRVHHFFTTNEIVCFTDLGYRAGVFAPGLKLPPGEANQVRHHGILGHGLAVQALRASAKPGTLVGIAENPTVCVPVMETPDQVEASRKAMRVLNAPFLTAIMEGKYPAEYLEQEGAAAPKFNGGDMKAIGSPLDFVGLNVYSPEYIQAAGAPLGFELIPKPSSFPHMASPWLSCGPEVIYWAVRHVSEIWKPKALYITENGCSSNDIPGSDGRVRDTDRLMYLRNHLTHLQRAATEGYPIKGYFLWSLLDNFEWADGYSKRFGVHYVDFETQKRTPKLSAAYYRNTISSNSVA